MDATPGHPVLSCPRSGLAASLAGWTGSGMRAWDGVEGPVGLPRSQLPPGPRLPDPIMPEVTHTPVLPDEPAAIVGSQFTFEQICAFGLAMGWGDRPLSFVVKNWMDSRPAFAIEDIIGLPR